MDEHAQALVHPHVEVDVPVSGAGIPVLKPANLQLERLLVELGLVRRRNVDLPDDAGRHHVVDGLTVSVLLDVDRGDGELGVRRVVGLNLLRTGQALLELSPFTPNELQTGEPQRDRLAPPLHEHPHEPDAPEIADAAHALLEVADGHLELQPLDLLGLPVGHGLARHQHIGQVVAADVGLRQIAWAKGDAVLEVALDCAEGQVLVEVLRVGEGGRGDGVALRLGRARVALISVEEAVALEHIFLVGLGHRIAEVAEVVGGGVGPVGVIRFRLEVVLQSAQPVPEEFLLLLRIQAVQAHVLQAVVSRGVVEGVHHIEGGRIRHQTPIRLLHRRRLVGRRQAILEGKLTVVEQVLADGTEVQIEFPSRVVLAVLVEGIHHPELDVLHVGELEVGGEQGALDAAPPLLGRLQRAVGIQARDGTDALGRQIVVGSSDGRIEREVEGGQVLRRAERQLAVREHLLVLDQTHQVVGANLHVHLPVGETATEETRINGVPIQTGPVEVEQEAVLHVPLRKQVGLQLRRTGQAPLRPRTDVNGTLGALEIVDVGVALLADRPAVARNQVGRFRTDVDVGRSRRLEERQLVQHVGDELTRAGIRKVRPHDGVVHRLVADVDLLGQRALPQVQEGRPEGQVFTWRVIEAGAQQRLGLDVEQAVALEGDPDGLAALEQSVIDDAHPAEIVVDRVVLILDEPRPS